MIYEICWQVGKIIIFYYYLMNSEGMKYFKYDEINDKFLNDAELLINNNNKPVRKHFRCNLHYLLTEHSNLFEYADNDNCTGIKLIITDDEDINNNNKHLAFHTLSQFYVIPKRLQKKYYH